MSLKTASLYTWVYLCDEHKKCRLANQAAGTGIVPSDYAETDGQKCDFWDDAKKTDCSNDATQGFGLTVKIVLL